MGELEPGSERHEADLALSVAYAEILEAQNPEADPDTIAVAAVELTLLLEPLARSDTLTNFQLHLTIHGLEFDILQED